MRGGAGDAYLMERWADQLALMPLLRKSGQKEARTAAGANDKEPAQEWWKLGIPFIAPLSGSRWNPVA